MRRQEEEQMPMDYGLPPMGYNPMMPMTPYPGLDAGTYEKIIDTNELIDEFVMTLRGQVIDPKTNKIVQQSKPIVSEEGINWVTGRVRPYTSKIFSLSVLDEKTVKTIIYEFAVSVTTDLMFPERYGVTRENRSYVKDVIVHTFMASIYKAKEGETLKRLLAQYHIAESTIKNQEREGFFKKLGLKF